MNLLQPIWQDLKTKRLWPVALVLLVAIAAVPLVLSSSSSPPAPAPVASGQLPSQVAGIPAVSERSGPANVDLNGRARDPFAPQQGSGSPASATSTTSAGSPVTPVAPVSSGSGGSGNAQGSPSSGSPSGGATGSGSPPPQTPTVPPKIPVGKPKRTTASLAPDESYVVALAMTNARGGIETIDPLERLSVLPRARQPLLVELGVLKGGKRVLFAVQPGTLVNGPGTCIPGPIDCEILSLAQNQTEKLGVRSSHGNEAVAMFALTGISVAGHPSRAAAQKARRAESAAGRRVLAGDPLSALSLFRYDPAAGAVLDLRNLTLRNS